MSWSLCFLCLFVSGYHYYISTLLAPWIAKFRRSALHLVCRITTCYVLNKRGSNASTYLRSKCTLPLTTISRNEIDRLTPIQRYYQLIEMLQRRGFSVSDLEYERNGCSKESMINHDLERREQLVKILRTDNICRRLASLAMRPFESNCFLKGYCRTYQLRASSSSLLDQEPRLKLAHELAAIWPQLLELPRPPPVPKRNERLESKADKGIMFDLTVVIPAYSETGTMLECQILHLL